MAPETVDELIFYEALKNAAEHGGKASPQAVMGKVIARNPLLKGDVRALMPRIFATVARVNGMSSGEQEKELARLSSLSEEPRPTAGDERGLPDLPERPEVVVTRFAPNPDGPLHVGNLRAAVLSHAYARKFGGKFILRFEDTDPKVKPPILKAYEWIKRDLDWLGIRFDEVYYQSDRLEIYYEYARKLLNRSAAYVCECGQDEFKRYRAEGVSCPHRARKDSQSAFERMVSGHFEEGGAVLRLVSSMTDPNPSLRDPPLLRIIDTEKHPHPRLGSKYILFPLYNFSAAVDDALMGVTLIFRGKEHLANSHVQAMIQTRLGFSPPFSIQYGRLKLEGYILSKSKIRSTLGSTSFTSPWPTLDDGWDDPRLATVMALKRRGFDPRALISLILEVGFKPSEATISWDNLAVLNRRLVEPKARRFFWVFDPIAIDVEGIPFESKTVLLPVHPSNAGLGSRILEVKAHKGKAEFLVQRKDVVSATSGSIMRFMGLFNIELSFEGDRVSARFVSEEPVAKAPIIHWLQPQLAIPSTLYFAKGMDLAVMKGVAEANILDSKVGDVVQLVRLGYARIDFLAKDEVRLVFAHD
jgi:glutamyl-tRNA synthetase